MAVEPSVDAPPRAPPPRHPAVFQSRYCRSSCAASSISLCRPRRCAVVAGDQPHPVQTAKVAIYKRVARLRLLGHAFGI